MHRRLHSVPLMLMALATCVLGPIATGCSTIESSRSPSEKPIASVSVSDARDDETLPLADSELQLAVPATSTSVRWGGTITRIQNTADQRTEIEIVSRPLRGNGKPVHNDLSDGRFIAYVETFLDPEIFKVGRDITVTGTLYRRQSGKIGETDYRFPVVKVENYSYWKMHQQQRQQRHFPHWNDHRAWTYDPFWPYWYRRHSHRGARP